MAAILAFDEPIILLAGGRDKDMIWEPWARLVTRRVKAVILFGELGPMLEEILAVTTVIDGGKPLINRVDTMLEAVDMAVEIATEGDVVLLSPGGTSFDAFVDFAERGRDFRRIVYAMVENSQKGTRRKANAS